MMSVDFSACEHALQYTFGLPGWRRGQKAAVRTILRGRDLLAIFPTGAGKSLCYQLPAVVHGGLTLVVSPLIALMEDQVRHLREREISAALLSSHQSADEQLSILAAVHQGDVRLLYVSPERLTSPTFRAAMQETSPWLIVVDEAHCVARWGNDFRPEYAEIGGFAAFLPKRPVICAMTATADRRIRKTIIQSLHLRLPKHLTLPSFRENLTYRVHLTMHRSQCILQTAERHPNEHGIVYCSTRKRTEQLAKLLQSKGFSALPYHAGFSQEERLDTQHAFEENRCQIVCATIAFGMGIDLPDIRWIVHDAMPQDLTDYAQQTGRAGRDGNPAVCTLLFSPADYFGRIRRTERMKRDQKVPLLERYRKSYREQQDLQKLLRVLFSNHCIPAALARGFGQRIRPCGKCVACQRNRKAYFPRMTLRRVSMADHKYRMLVVFRAAIANSRGCDPESLMSSRSLRDAVQFDHIPLDEDGDPQASALLEELFLHMRELSSPVRKTPSVNLPTAVPPDNDPSQRSLHGSQRP